MITRLILNPARRELRACVLLLGVLLAMTLVPPAASAAVTALSTSSTIKAIVASPGVGAGLFT